MPEGGVKLTLGSRGSQLALLQAKEAIAALLRVTPGLAAAVEPVKTSGDAFRGALEAAPLKGVFVREIDERVLAGELDAGVHSLKDVPTDLPPGLTIAAVLERHFPGDVLFGALPLAKLPPGASVGTSSPRRRAQILRLRPDLAIQELRGNVPTRIERVAKREVSAAPVAKAACIRLGIRTGFFELPLQEFPPAPGQGAACIVAREGSDTARLLARADHTKTRQEVSAERAVLEALGGGCSTPLGVSARRTGALVDVTAMLLARDGSDHVILKRQLPSERAAPAGRVLGEELKREGARLLGGGA